MEIINDGTQIKSNWVGSLLRRMPQDNNAGQEEGGGGEERLPPHTSLEFNANQGEAQGFLTSHSIFEFV